jgi:hypothetical protein
VDIKAGNEGVWQVDGWTKHRLSYLVMVVHLRHGGPAESLADLPSR